MNSNSFKIKSIYISADSYGNGATVDCVVEVSATEWSKARNKGKLGHLYGVDISNAIYAINNNIPAHYPTIGDSDRAKNGIKTISVSYRCDSARAQKLGLEGFTTKAGEFIFKFNAFKSIYPIAPLKLVVSQ